MVGYLLSGLAVGLPAAAQPGPFQAYLLSQTMKNGWRRTLLACLGPLLSDGPIILLVVIVLTQLPAWFLQTVQIIGGLFLLYLAARAWRTFRTVDFAALHEEPASAQQSLLEAALMNLLNPNPFIFWGLVAGPRLVQGWRESIGAAIAFLIGFYGTLIGGFALLVILFGAARNLGAVTSKALTGVSAVALALFGIFQLWQGLLAG